MGTEVRDRPPLSSGLTGLRRGGAAGGERPVSHAEERGAARHRLHLAVPQVLLFSGSGRVTLE